MFRKGLYLLLLFFILLAVSACGSEDNPDGSEDNSNSTGEVEQASTEQSMDNGLPPLPDFIQEKGKLIVGVKADFPPFGFINENGEPDGYDIDLAKTVAEYAFGDSEAIEFVTVTSANRIPFLDSEKVDVVIATLGITEERMEQIDFTDPYYNAAHMLLVPKDSDIEGLDDIEGEDVTTVKGATGSMALEKLVPSANQLKYDSNSEALRALKQGRGVAMVQDDILLYDIVEQNPDLKMVGEPFEPTPMAMGVRKGEEEWVEWLNAAIEKALEEDLFYEWFKKWYPNVDEVPELLPRP